MSFYKGYANSARDLLTLAEVICMGKKHRNRINSPKKNNHIPKEAIIAEHEAHGDEYSATNRKNGPGHHTRDY